MDNTVWTVTRATVDGVLFRTRSSQIRKNTKSDNSCMVGEVNVTLPNGKEERQKCYGVIKKFFLHFMYPPPSKQTYKLNMRKLAKIDTPWILCAECDWYEYVGVHTINGLVRIQPNRFWDYCPLFNMASVIPSNVAFWPEDPFNPDHFDDEGAPQENMQDGVYNFFNISQKLNVINL